MLRICVLQRLCGLSDLDMMERLYDPPVMRRFVGLGEGDDIPEDGEIFAFRRTLEQRGLARRISRVVDRRLARHGVERREIADVLVVPPPDLSRLLGGGRDPETGQGGEGEARENPP